MTLELYVGKIEGKMACYYAEMRGDEGRSTIASRNIPGLLDKIEEELEKYKAPTMIVYTIETFELVPPVRALDRRELEGLVEKANATLSIPTMTEKGYKIKKL